MSSEIPYEKVTQILNTSESTILNSQLPNPFYGKDMFFFKGCIGPKPIRTQLMGYLGAFSGSPKKLDRKIDIAIIPTDVYNNLINHEGHIILNNIINQVHYVNPKTGHISNKIPNTLILQEKVWLNIVIKLCENDTIKMKLLKMLNK